MRRAKEEGGFWGLGGFGFAAGAGGEDLGQVVDDGLQLGHAARCALEHAVEHVSGLGRLAAGLRTGVTDELERSLQALFQTGV